MRKILFVIIMLFLLSGVCYGAAISDWIRGDGSDAVKGTDNASDIDYDVTNYLQDPLDKLLTEEIHGCSLSYGSASTVTIAVGEVTCYNSAKTIKRMRRNTATVTITLPASGASGGSLDTGNAAVSTWYHVYAVADADATTFTGICSASASAPTGYTYYRYLGAFYNNASDDIDKFYWFGSGNSYMYVWDIPVSVSTTVSADAWSAAISCAKGMPSTSTCGIFGVYGYCTTTGVVFIRPNGSTWHTNYENGVSFSADYGSGQRVCFTDASQQIQEYFTSGGYSGTVGIDVEGFYGTR